MTGQHAKHRNAQALLKIIHATGSTIGKLACAVAMMGLFAVNVILKSGAAPGAVREVVMRAVGGG